MNRIQDSVVQGNISGGDYNESTTYISNAVESGRVSCPSCATSGMITIYQCTSCRSVICDACRVNGCYCQPCWNRYLTQQNLQLEQKEGERKRDLTIFMLGLLFFIGIALIPIAYMV